VSSSEQQHHALGRAVPLDPDGPLPPFADDLGQPVFVRGANVRVVIFYDGTLGWVKAFVLRDAPESVPVFYDLAEVVSRVESDFGYTVVDAERQLVFVDHDSTNPLPMWCVRFETPDGPMGEFFVDGPSGAVLDERHFVFEFTGSVRAFSPTTNPTDDESHFSTPADFLNANPVTGARVLGAVSSALTNTVGEFELENPGPVLEVLLEHPLDGFLSPSGSCPQPAAVIVGQNLSCAAPCGGERRDTFLVAPDLFGNQDLVIGEPRNPEDTQPLTPMIIHHEVAHHIVQSLTGALLSQRV
jgi:hypothetical protein